MATESPQIVWDAARCAARSLFRSPAIHQDGLWTVEDLAHEGFLSAQAHIGKCRVPTRLFAFAYTCAHRGILRWVAAQERRAAHEYRVASWDDLPEALLAVSPEGTIQSAVDYARYVAGLPAVTQTIWRKRLLGFSWREIALHEQQALSTLFRQHRPIACLVP